MHLNRLCPSNEGWGPWNPNKELDLTPCFEHGVIMPVLNMLFISFAMYRLTQLRALYDLPDFYTKTVVFWVKLALASVIAIAATVELVLTVALLPLSETFNVFTVSLLVQSVAYLVAIRLHYYEHTRSRRSSDILLLYWLTTIIVTLVTLRTDLDTKYSMYSTYYAVRATRYVMLVSMFALFGAELSFHKISEYVLAEDGDIDVLSTSRFGVRALVENANVFSQLTFSWISPILRLSQNKQIDENDLSEIPTSMAPVNVAEVFDAHWQHEIRHHEKRTPSLIRALWKTVGVRYIFGGILKLVFDTLMSIRPLLLSQLLGFAASYSTDSPLPLSHGYFYACCMLVGQGVQSLFFQQYLQVCTNTGMVIKTCLTTAVYKKVIRLSNEARQEYTTGKITTLYSVDVERIGGVVEFVHFIWSGPLQILVATVLLYNTLGWSVFAGIAIMLFSVPANRQITMRMRALQSEQMKNRDKRCTLISEALSNVKVIKLYAWERPILRKIQYIRESLELVSLSKYGHMIARTSVTMISVPFLVSFTTFLMYTLFDNMSHGPLTARLVFVSLALFGLLRSPLTTLPNTITNIVNANIALGRIHKLLTSDELDSESVTKLRNARQSNHISSGQGNSVNDDMNIAVKVIDGYFSWSSTELSILNNVNFSALSNEHLAIVGRVGSGKSSLLSALLGEMRKEKGDVVLCGKIAYIPQQPWIMNSTLRNNILFGLQYDESFYNRVIDACALRPDLDIFSAGDMTEIGERGINLSGGQKARVSLARAVYAQADIYILDDPLSAVDAHVARHLFDQVLGPAGLLKSRCRIHATNAIQYISKCDSVLMLQDGHVAEYGTIGALIENSGQVHGLIQEYGVAETAGPNILSNIDDSTIQNRQSTIDSLPPARTMTIQRDSQLCVPSDSIPGKLIAKEVSAIGKISMSTYMDYFRTSTWTSWALFTTCLSLCQAFLVFGNIWLKIWANANEAREGEGTSDKHSEMFYIAIYGICGLASSIFSYSYQLIQWSMCAVRSGRTTHRKMLTAVFRSPMSFFDTTPQGRILQRFSKDQTSIDEVVPYTFGAWYLNLVILSYSFAVIAYSIPAFSLVFIPVTLAFAYLKNYFLDPSRTLKRLLSTTRSPIYASFQEMIVGVSTIRAFDKSESFMAEHLQKLTVYQRCAYMSTAMIYWMAVRVDFISTIIVFTTAILCVTSLLYGKIDIGIFGLSLTYALQNTTQLGWMLRTEGDLENSMCDYMRVQEYAKLLPEAPDVIEDKRPARSWPEQGIVEFRNYSTRYREGLDLVLKDVSFVVRPREKVGIVGRTGAGKSSLTMALFRIIEATEGQILLDGKDIAQYGLFDVRSKLSIIPQDPVLFAGTVRENLDPFSTYSDQDIWRALEHAQLADYIRAKDERLEFEVMQGGENFSVGQRQLICLARALLKRAKVLVLDEATAAIDPESDAIIQNSIRKEFKDCTVLTIAHRLNTIIDSDRILVLDQGQVAEFDTPEVLLAKEDGLFKELWARANES